MGKTFDADSRKKENEESGDMQTRINMWIGQRWDPEVLQGLRRSSDSRLGIAAIDDFTKWRDLPC